MVVLLGLFAVPSGTLSENSSPKPVTVTATTESSTAGEPSESAATPRADKNPDLAVLAPLVELTEDGSSRRIDDRVEPPKFDRAGRQGLVREVVTQARQRGGTVRAMIALVPDSAHTSASQDFDAQLQALQRAAEASGFVLAQFRFPWNEKDKSHKASSDEHRDAELKSSLPREAPEAKGAGAGGEPSIHDPRGPWSPRPGDQPGLLVFRKGEMVLAVFLVLETPTRGLRKHQFNWSLDLLDSFADATEPSDGDTVPRSFRIAGPRYTGTQTSLNQALDGWLIRSPSERLRGGRYIPPLYRCSYRFSIAAAATEIDADYLKNLHAVAAAPVLMLLNPLQALLLPRSQEIVFRSASNSRNDSTSELIDFLETEYRVRRVALLLESNTIFGNKLGNDLDGARGTKIDVYHYPLHIASLRASYEKQGLLRDAGGQVFRSAAGLEQTPDEDERPRDVVPSVTPEFSTRVDDLVMVQTMTEIARGISLQHYDSVGIAGSSSRDIIFLAQLVCKYSPDAVIFTNTSDLLFTQAQTITDLRGMLVGSTYPLYAPNRLWSYPYGDGTDVFFNQDSAQAFYNAMMCLLSEIFHNDQEITKAAIPLEFSQPFQKQANPPKPPIWISVVGNRGIYPLRVIDRARAKGKIDQWPALPDSIRGVPAVFRPSYHTFWKVLEWLLLLLGAVMFGLALVELWWVLARINQWDLSGWLVWKILKQLALFLVWSRAGNHARQEPNAEALHSSSGHGPGVFLVFAHIAFFLVYLTVNRPFLFPSPSSPGRVADDWWHAFARVGFRVALASLAVSVVAWILLAVEKLAFSSLALMAAVVIATILGVVFWVPKLDYDSLPESNLALERIVAVTSGVSPTFPMLFVGVGVASLLVAQLKRRYLNEQFALNELATRSKSDGSQPVQPTDLLTDVEEEIDELRAVFHKPLRALTLGDLIPTCLLAVYVVTLVSFGLWHGFGVSFGEGWVFNTIFWTFFALLWVLLAFHVYLVFVVWSHLREILAQVSRLPLARAFERMPTRVARWFFEAPTLRNRAVMIQDQATALAARCGPSRVMSALARLCSVSSVSQDNVSLTEWDALPGRLSRMNEPVTSKHEEEGGGWKSVKAWLAPLPEFLQDARAFVRLSPSAPAPRISESSGKPGPPQGQRTDRNQDKPTERQTTPGQTVGVNRSPDEPTVTAEANEILKKILRRVWEGRPLTWTFAEGKAAEKVQEEPAAGWPIAPRTAAVLVGKADYEEENILAGVREWTEMAEDLIAIELLRHLSQFLAHIWVIVGFIVFGSFALLLAINSYPFPMQNRIGFFLATLIIAAGCAILRLVVGINRDETISQVANTVAGLKLDRNLASSLVSYILPLIGILTAISYDISDLLRVWLDPVFRILM